MSVSLRRLASLRSGSSSFSSTAPTLVEQSSDNESLYHFLQNDIQSRSNQPPSSQQTSSSSTRSATPIGYTRPPQIASSVRTALVPIDEEEIPDPVPLDRTIDRLCVAKPENIPLATDTAFGQLRPPLIADPSVNTLFTLPTYVRKNIYSYCFPTESRKINLSAKFAIKAIFPEDYFGSPWDALEPVWGGLQSGSMFLRKDLLAYFWTEYSFHATLSPFTGPKLSPLSQVWLRPYLGIIQKLTLEMDCTRFGGSVLRYAPEFGYDTNKTERLMSELVGGLSCRELTFGMAELHLMCRRYAGFRPWDGFCVTEDNVPYYPDEATYLCDTLTELRGMVRRVRVSGFTLEYTEAVLVTLFGADHEPLDITIPEDSAWPPDPDADETTSTALSSSRVIPVSEFGLTLGALPHGRSFTEEFETEMVRMNNFPTLDEAANGNYTTEHIIETGDEIDSPLELEMDTRPTNRLAEHVRKYSLALHTNISTTHFSNPTTPSDSDPTTPRFTHFHNNEIIHTRSTRVEYSARTSDPELPTSFSEPFPTLSPHPSPQKIRKPSPEPLPMLSPTKLLRKISTKRSANQGLGLIPKFSEELERLNAMNEQDPAFVRAVNALRGVDSERGESRENEREGGGVGAGRDGMGERPTTSLSARRPCESTKRRYFSFVNRLRGRVDTDN